MKVPLFPGTPGALVGAQLGSYQLMSLLAVGGTAEVYYAKSSGSAKISVIKVMHEHLADDPEFIKMFLDEARLAALFTHPNIVQTFDLGQFGKRYFIVMELLQGLSLSMVLKLLDGKPVPRAIALNIAAQTAAALHHAHELIHHGRPLNVVHRDVSPQNLVVTFDGVVKLVDFGIARSDGRETKTKAGTIKGKFAYMAPEQCVAGAVDRRTDVFSLGVVLYELLTNRRLFKRDNPYDTYQAAIACEVPSISSHGGEIDPALDELVERALRKLPSQRYANAEEFGEAIISYLHHRALPWRPSDVADFLREQFPNALRDFELRSVELSVGQELTQSIVFDWGGEEPGIVEISELSSPIALSEAPFVRDWSGPGDATIVRAETPHDRGPDATQIERTADLSSEAAGRLLTMLAEDVARNPLAGAAGASPVTPTTLPHQAVPVVVRAGAGPEAPVKQPSESWNWMGPALLVAVGLLGFFVALALLDL